LEEGRRYVRWAVRTSVLNLGEGKLPHLAALSCFKLTLLSCHEDDNNNNNNNNNNKEIYKSAFPNIPQQFAF